MDSTAADEELAQRFHEAYERLAPSFGYRTREASAKPWKDVPEDNRRLMIAVVAEIRTGLDLRAADVAALRARARELRATWPADRETDYVVGFQDAANYLEALPIE